LPAASPGGARRRAQSRSAFLDEAAGITPYVAVAIGDELFFVPSGDAGVGRRVFVDGWRSDMTVLERAIAQLGPLADGATFVDIGANIGTTTVMALRRHGFASAVAIEPSPENFTTLRINLAANGIDSRVEALPVAASDREGELPFKVGKQNTGGHRLAGAKAKASSFSVQTVTLDGLVERGTIDVARAGLVWVDAVGHEAKALAGGTKLLEAGVPVVTAIKVGWTETLADLVRVLTPHYTEVVELRQTQEARPIGELGALIDSLTRSTDVLLVRR
jgi:FkbM family methyltransferase